MADRLLFPPTNVEDIRSRGWDCPDFVYVCGDAYVDHPSFGAAVITRVLERAGWRVAVLAQPGWKDSSDFKRFGRPRYGFLVSSGVIDSMVNHYTAAKRKRSSDVYTPGGAPAARPDRAVTVYCRRIREAFGEIPIAIGGVEASLRRFAHYDYWADTVKPSILWESGADLLIERILPGRAFSHYDKKLSLHGFTSISSVLILRVSRSGSVSRIGEIPLRIR